LKHKLFIAGLILAALVLALLGFVVGSDR